MRNITLSINDKTYHAVRVWCAERDTSVSRVVQMFLEDLLARPGIEDGSPNTESNCAVTPTPGPAPEDLQMAISRLLRGISG
jgi:hypothetical protein